VLKALAFALGVLGFSLTAAVAEEWVEEWLRGFVEGCRQNNAAHCSIAGSYYYNGRGVKKDDFRAVEFFTKACDLNGMDCGILGHMHQNGKGIKKTSFALWSSTPGPVKMIFCQRAFTASDLE
jgi:TPR repeat protein